jgi:glutamine amidotransferase
MCRLLGYVGPVLQLDHLLYKPDHSLIVQSYAPREMTAGTLNADGFGIGWHHAQRRDLPYIYRSVLPIWNDLNLNSLSRYVESGCVVASVRSATPGLAVDLSNCPPFQHEQVLMVHNGFIQNFRQTLYRPIRDRLSDTLYQAIHGTTDSEHLFALILHEWQRHPGTALETALEKGMQVAYRLAREVGEQHVPRVGGTLILSDGEHLIASRTANCDPVPTLYWLRDNAAYPGSVLVASEPMFAGDWQLLPEHHMLIGDRQGQLEIHPLHL